MSRRLPSLTPPTRHYRTQVLRLEWIEQLSNLDSGPDYGRSGLGPRGHSHRHPSLEHVPNRPLVRQECQA